MTYTNRSEPDEHGQSTINTKLAFGPGAKPLSEQLIESGLNPHLIKGQPTDVMNDCQKAIDLLRIAGVIDEEERIKLCQKLCGKIEQFTDAVCAEIRKMRSN